MLSSLPEKTRRAAIRELSGAEAEALLHDWRFWARPSQLPPPGDWTTWLVLAGRGFGKTRMGVEWVRSLVEGATPLTAPGGGIARIALVAETAADARGVVVEGASGFLALCPRGFRPRYEATKRRLTWPNGAVATLYNAVEPDQLRGPQHHAAWGDELAKWRYARETYDNLQFGLRLGRRPRQMFTTTPRPLPLIKELIADPATVVTRGATRENLANLAPAFVQTIIRKYEGTRLGRQELEAEILEDMPGALWRREAIERARVKAAPALERIVVAVDPAVTSGAESDETGIIVAGRGGGHGYVLDDRSRRASPMEWAREAVAAYRRRKADRIVAEVNNGGDLVAATIRMIDGAVAFKPVRASRGKQLRAEPVAALYEQGRVHHVGAFPELEDQMCGFAGAGDRRGAGSPDRLDALVWALTELLVEPVEIGIIEFYRDAAGR